MNNETVLYEIDVPEDQRNILDDVPKAYRVMTLSKCSCIVYGKYRDGQWIANASSRWLVKHLISALAASRAENERLRELYRAERIRYFPFYGSPNYAAETEANIKSAAVGGEVFAQCVSNLSRSRSESAARIKAAAGGEGK